MKKQTYALMFIAILALVACAVIHKGDAKAISACLKDRQESSRRTNM